MIITLYGPDAWRRQAKKRDILAEFAHKNPAASTTHVSGENDDAIRELRNLSRQTSMFGIKRLLLLSEISLFPAKELKEELKFIHSDKEVSALISEEKIPDPLDFILKSPGIAAEFAYLDGKDWEKFVAMQAKKLELALDADNLRRLAAHFRKNTWGLMTELLKLRNLPSAAAAKQIPARWGRPMDFWATFSGLRGRDLNSRLTALALLEREGEPAAKTFYMLAAFANEIGLSRFAEYDTAVKSGKLEYEEALTGLVLF